MTTPKLSPAQDAYATARAAYETVLAAYSATARKRVIAAGLNPDSADDSDAALEIEEAVRERREGAFGTYAAPVGEALRAASLVDRIGEPERCPMCDEVFATAECVAIQAERGAWLAA